MTAITVTAAVYNKINDNIGHDIQILEDNKKVFFITLKCSHQLLNTKNTIHYYYTITK